VTRFGVPKTGFALFFNSYGYCGWSEIVKDKKKMPLKLGCCVGHPALLKIEAFGRKRGILPF
jgi:hypothetical protein